MAHTGHRRFVLGLSTLVAVLLLLFVGAVVVGVDGIFGSATEPDVAGSPDGETEADREDGRGRQARDTRRRRHRDGFHRDDESRNTAHGTSTDGAAEDEERGDEAEDETASVDDGAGPTAVGDDAPPPGHLRVRGRVRVPDGAEIPTGARVLVAVDGAWWGSEVGADGTFHADVLEDFLADAGGRLEIRVRAEGYRLTVVPHDVEAADEVVVPLEPQPDPPAFGAVRLFVSDEQGRVHHGPVLLTTYDAMGDHHGRLVHTDEGGGADLLALTPGPWTLRAVGGARETEVHVPEGGTARAQVVVGDWPGELTAEEFQARHARLAAHLEPGRVDLHGDPPTEPDLQHHLRAENHLRAQQELEQRWRMLRPQVQVRLAVTDLAPRSTGFLNVRLRAAWGPGVSWVLPLDEATATATISPERWTVSLLREGREYPLGELDLTGHDPLDPDETEPSDAPPAIRRTFPAPPALRLDVTADGR